MSHIVTFSVNTPLPLSQSMLDWAKANCASYITNDAARNHYEFYFSERKDACAFFAHWAATNLPMQIIEKFG